MKYFIDTEFIEGFHKPLLGKKRHFIDLISIGIVCEDGRTYYAISNEYNYNDADDWVKENVILPAYVDAVHGDNRNRYDCKNFNKYYGKSNKVIVHELLNFFGCYRDVHFWRVGKNTDIEIYGYYADYDWVLFCSLFGRMIDLPKGFPMYCKDLKQMLYEYAERKLLEWGSNAKNFNMLTHIKSLPDFPVQKNEHNALADAKWNLELYKFLQKITHDNI